MLNGATGSARKRIRRGGRCRKNRESRIGLKRLPDGEYELEFFFSDYHRDYVRVAKEP